MRFSKLSTLASAFLSVLFLLLCFQALAQTPTAIVNGTVMDSSGATVPEATVKVTNQDTNVTSQKVTNSSAARRWRIGNMDLSKPQPAVGRRHPPGVSAA